MEIPNCIKGHCPSLSVCVPNPVLAMFHYLNYYHLAQRWTQPRTPPENYRWVEERESKGGEGYKEESPSLYQKKEKREKKGNKEDRFMEKSS